MKTRLLKKLRKAAKEEFRIDLFSSYYRVFTYSNSLEEPLLVTLKRCSTKKEALEELFIYRRNFILNKVSDMKRKRINKELAKI